MIGMIVLQKRYNSHKFTISEIMKSKLVQFTYKWGYIKEV